MTSPLIAGLFLAIVFGAPAHAQSRLPPDLLVPTSRSEALQERRLQMMAVFQVTGVFEKHQGPGDTKVAMLWVRPTFYEMDFTLKERVVALFYAYYFDGSDDFLVGVRDSRSNKSVGRYSRRGLDLD